MVLGGNKWILGTLKDNCSQNISKVHMKDRTDFGLSPKVRRRNQFS